MRRWKPNSAQRAEYKERMEFLQTLNIVPANGAIRTGCYVKFFKKSEGIITEGTVIKHSYGKATNQHTFTIQDPKGNLHLVKGRNLYDSLMRHIQGNESMKLDLKTLK